MYVHRTPLASSSFINTNPALVTSQDPVETAYEASTLSTRQTGGNRGWLSNLASDMRSEQPLVDRLYPLDQSTAAGNRASWSCPLLRIAFWSKVVNDFSPLLPSPVRSARIFGGSDRDMLHSTRSHPTQMFSNLYDRLANVMTSNGFCYCTNAADCQVLHTSQDSKDCTLLETIKSLYDQTQRTARLLLTTGTTNTCKQQLDWPFEPGTMRDGMPTTGINDGTKPCNVLDRIPLFKYMY